MDVKASIYFDSLSSIITSVTMLKDHGQKRHREVTLALRRMSHTKMKPLDQFLIPDPHMYYNHPEMALGIYRTALAQVGTKTVIMLFL